LTITAWYEKDNWISNILLCFGLLKNWKLLLAPNRGGDFDTLDGIRALSMSWVIFGHTFIFLIFMWSFTNAYEVVGVNGEGFLATYSAQALTGGYFAVDSFFFMGAFLASYLLLENLTKTYNSKNTVKPFLFQVPKLYLLRWVRLTPAYFYVRMDCMNAMIVVVMKRRMIVVLSSKRPPGA